MGKKASSPSWTRRRCRPAPPSLRLRRQGCARERGGCYVGSPPPCERSDEVPRGFRPPSCLCVTELFLQASSRSGVRRLQAPSLRGAGITCVLVSEGVRAAPLTQRSSSRLHLDPRQAGAPCYAV